MAQDPEIEKLQKEIDKLNEKIGDLERSMGNLERSSSGVSDNIGKTNNLLGDAVRSVITIQKNFRKFATDTREQYVYAEKLAESSKKTAVQMGISVGRSSEFTKNWNKSLAQLQKFGMDVGDVNNIMTEFSESSGRARILSEDEVLRIGLMEKGLNVGQENAARLYEKMDLMGVSAADASDKINSMVRDSQKLGLNASKVAKVLANNFDSMSSMSFKSGVKGMTEMAKLAVKMRMDVSDMLQMADKFYEPEAAIEAAANLQMLGGDIAKAFGDPFTLMYEARNKPEELAERVGAMVENMMEFNQETGEISFPPEVRMQLKAAGTQLGLNTDKMIDMAKQASKIKNIKMNVSGNIADEDMREGLASMAKMKDGKWVVDFKGEELDIGDIGMDKAAEILAAPKDTDDAIMEMAYNSMTTNQILENIEKALKTGLVAEFNMYEITEDVLRPGMEELFKGVEGQVTKMFEIIKNSPIGDIRTTMQEQAKAMGIATGEGLKNLFEAGLESEMASKIAETVRDKFKDMFETDIETILNTLIERFGGQHTEQTPGQHTDFILRSSGQVTSFTNEDDIIGAKKGGPLDKLMDKGLPNNNFIGGGNKIEFGTLDISGRIELYSPDGTASKIDMSTMQPLISDLITKKVYAMFNNGGSPDGANTPQPSRGYGQLM